LIYSNSKISPSSILLLTVIFTLIISFFSYSQETVRIMSYNLLNYANDDDRDQYFRSIISDIDPDIMIGIEIYDQNSANDFLNNVLNSVGEYAMGDYVSTSLSDNNVVYYKPTKFTFLESSIVIESGNHPSLKFQLFNNLTRDTVTLFGIHFTSNDGSQTQRNIEAQAIRDFTALFPSTENFIALGDYNLTEGGTESAYSTLLDETNPGFFVETTPLGAVDWHDSDPAFAPYHTISTRESAFGGGVGGSLDDRFDLILNSETVNEPGGITFISFVTYGNDGLHYNEEITASPTIPEGITMANALYNASDHLPIYADYNFGSPSPGGIAFTQVGSTSDIIEFITLNDHMDLTKLKITDSEINSGGELVNGNGTYDLSNTSWKDVPGGTFVRLGSLLTNDNDPADRILVYNGTGSSSLPNLSGGDNGDQLIAYTGSATNPYFIAGITWGNDGWALAKSNSIAPGTISDVALGSSNNYYFSGSVDGDAATTRTALTNPSNWSSFGGTIFNDLTSTIGNGALPVELSFFTGTLNGRKVQLRWKTETEVNNYGFEIERSTGASETNWETIGFIKGNGNSNSQKDYAYSDAEIDQSGNYLYRLKQINNNGTYEYSDVVTVGVGAPDKYELSQNYPNPFNPETRINFSIPVKQYVSLKVYNSLGELVKELINEYKEAGSYSVEFNASNLSNGIYIYRLETQNFVSNKKMTLIK